MAVAGTVALSLSSPDAALARGIKGFNPVEVSHEEERGDGELLIPTAHSARLLGIHAMHWGCLFKSFPNKRGCL